MSSNELKTKRAVKREEKRDATRKDGRERREFREAALRIRSLNDVLEQEEA